MFSGELSRIKTIIDECVSVCVTLATYTPIKRSKLNFYYIFYITMALRDVRELNDGNMTGLASELDSFINSAGF